MGILTAAEYIYLFLTTVILHFIAPHFIVLCRCLQTERKAPDQQKDYYSTATIALLQWSGTEPEKFPRYACVYYRSGEISTGWVQGPTWSL